MNKMDIDLGVAFQPFAFLSAIGKNIVNFITPGPAIFSTKAVTYALPAEAAATIANIAPWTVSQVTAPPVSAATTIAKVATQVAPNVSTAVWDAIGGITGKVLDFFLTKGQLETYTSVAQSQADSARAAQAVVEAQERIVATQTQQEKESQGILSTETWKKAAPYVIPVAAGLAIVAILLIISKGRKESLPVSRPKLRLAKA